MDIFPICFGLPLIRHDLPQPVVPFPCVLILRCTYRCCFVPVFSSWDGTLSACFCENGLDYFREISCREKVIIILEAVRIAFDTS